MKNQFSRWKLAPISSITVAVIGVFFFAVLALFISLSNPWVGVIFDSSYQSDLGGVRVSAIEENSPAADLLHVGDVIMAIYAQQSRKVALSSFTTQEEPDQLPSYSEYNAFLEHQQAVFEVLATPSFTVILADQREIQLSPQKTRPLSTLPFTFWWLIFIGGTSLLLGISAWSMRPLNPVTRVLAISGIGFMVGAYSCGIYVSRELALPSKLFFGLEIANHLGIMVFAYSTCLFFWYYPKKLGSYPAALIYVVGVSALWLNETLQWLSWPVHVFYAHFLVAYFLLCLFAYCQWRRSRGVPLDRSMLRWLLMVMVLNLGLTVVFFYVPVMMTGKSIASSVLTFGFVFLFYLGLVIGNIRYHQFDMDHWWRRAGQWMMFIFVAMLADAIFVYFLNITDVKSLGLAIGVGGFYLLARQWLWTRFSGKGSSALDRALPHLIETLMRQQKNDPPDLQWQKLIERVFNPLSIKVTPCQSHTVSIERNGIALQLPNLDGVSSIEALCCDRGNRLYNDTDVYLGNRLLELMRHSNDLLQAHEQGAETERRRIQRDLHDDVAARLLSLLHQTREPSISKAAQSALRGLRDVIHRLDRESASLMDVMNDIQASAREQIEETDVLLEWCSPSVWPSTDLDSGQHINLKRIFRETIANALRHAHPSNIKIDAQVDTENTLLSIRISNDGLITDPSNWISNRGLNNIRSRVAEIRGSHKWVIEKIDANASHCVLVLNVPLLLSEKSAQDTAD